MRILKYSIALLLTVVFLVAGALLPTAVVSALDRSALGQVGHADIASVELTLAEQREPMSIDEKLALMQIAMKVDIGFDVIENKAKMTEEEVLQATDIALAPYYDAGLLADKDRELSQCQPFLYYDRNDLETNAILWEVTLTENGAYERLAVVIDDDTGTLLHISCYAEETVFEEKERPKAAELFAEIYFDGVGWTEVADYWEEHGLVEQFEVSESGSYCIRYTFGDVLYGELAFEFYANRAASICIFLILIFRPDALLMHN